MRNAATGGHRYAEFVATYLDDILVAHRRRAEADGRSLTALLAGLDVSTTPRDFAGALQAPGLSVIAELKRKSPSAGTLGGGADPAEVALSYEAGGAAALSVLTDGPHFGGSAEDLIAAHEAVALPVLRKDFTVDPRDVVDARAMGADCVLLIVAALDDHELQSLLALARDLALGALVEVHDESELDRALQAGADLIGVNQRDLHTFEVDTERAVRVADRIPAGVVAVAESGVRGPEDAERLAAAGYDAILVGQSVVTADDRAGAVARLSGHPVGVRS